MDATVMQRLDDAGAVLVAKLSMGALAWGDVWFGGKTKTPWNLEHGASGSSAGSGAATAAGLGGFRHWHRDLGIDCLARHAQRRQRSAPHLWPRQPSWRYGFKLEHGQDRSHVSFGAGLRPGVSGDPRA